MPRVPKVSKPPSSGPRVAPRIRVLVGDEIALGPGKADLLAAIEASGSLAAAARTLDMSYMRAWTLVRTMNAAFRTPLVGLERGGSHQGGAHLTPEGAEALALYRAIEREALEAAQPAWKRLRRLLAKSKRGE